MSLENLSNFKNILNNRVDEFLIKISGKDKVLLKSLKKDWENFESEKSLDREKISGEINYCRYKFVKAPRTGDICGVKIKNKDSFYCSKHKKFAIEVSKKVLTPQSTSKKVLTPQSTLKEERIIPEKTISIRLNPIIGKFVHKESGMVFYSSKIREVCGRINTSGETIIPLTEEDTEICRKYCFKILRG